MITTQILRFTLLFILAVSIYCEDIESPVYTVGVSAIQLENSTISQPATPQKQDEENDWKPWKKHRGDNDGSFMRHRGFGKKHCQKGMKDSSETPTPLSFDNIERDQNYNRWNDNSKPWKNDDDYEGKDRWENRNGKDWENHRNWKDLPKGHKIGIVVLVIIASIIKLAIFGSIICCLVKMCKRKSSERRDRRERERLSRNQINSQQPYYYPIQADQSFPAQVMNYPNWNRAPIAMPMNSPYVLGVPVQIPYQNQNQPIQPIQPVSANQVQNQNQFQPRPQYIQDNYGQYPNLN